VESVASSEFYYHHCIELPSLVYILGSWPSVTAHIDDWIPTSQSQQLLQIFKKQIAVEWMFHIGIDQSETPLTGIVRSPIVEVCRYFISEPEKKQAFKGSSEPGRKVLNDQSCGRQKVIGEWRLHRDAEEMPEEFVLFTGWHSVEEHMAFAKDRFEKHSSIRASIEGEDIKHANLLHLQSEELI